MAKFGVGVVILKIAEGGLNLLDRITVVVSVLYTVVILRRGRRNVETSCMRCGIVSIGRKALRVCDRNMSACRDSTFNSHQNETRMKVLKATTYLRQPRSPLQGTKFRIGRSWLASTTRTTSGLGVSHVTITCDKRASHQWGWF